MDIWPTTHFAVVIYSFISNVLLTHLVIVFYAKKFEWLDLQPNNLQKVAQYYSSPWICLKAVACGSLFASCRNDWLSTPRQGRLLMFVLALPQLYRTKGWCSQQLRIVLGPLTPILVAHNLILQPADLGSIAMAATSFLAFGVLRPDNTAVRDLMALLLPQPPSGWKVSSLRSEAKTRRKLHGILAACNTALALWLLLEEERIVRTADMPLRQSVRI